MVTVIQKVSTPRSPGAAVTGTMHVWPAVKRGQFAVTAYVCKTDWWRPSQCIQNILTKCWSGATCRQGWMRGNAASGTLLDSWLRPRGRVGIWRSWPGSCHGLLRGNVTNAGSAWAATGSDRYKTACGFTSILTKGESGMKQGMCTAQGNLIIFASVRCVGGSCKDLAWQLPRLPLRCHPPLQLP